MARILVALAIIVSAPLLSLYILRNNPRSSADGPQPGETPERAQVFQTKDGAAGARPLPASSPTGPASSTERDAALAPLVAPDELSASLCPPEMALVVGAACPGVEHRCARSPATGSGGPCRAYEPAPRCLGKRRHVAFCVDRYEYPNVEGALPAMMLTFEQAEAACEHEGKRLCSEAEWAFACEGRGRAPYSQGFTLQEDLCNVGHGPDGGVPVQALWDPRTRAERVEALDGRTPAGARRCTSPFGVSDLLGNVREWVRSTPEGDHPGGLMGGDFTTGAVTCRNVRRIQSSHYAAFAVGTRCCADPLAEIPGAKP